MNIEIQNNSTEQQKVPVRLSRRSKAALAVAGIGLALTAGNTLAGEHEKPKEVPEKATAHASITAEFDGTGEGHKTAENAIRFALGEGATSAYASMDADGEALKTPNDIVELVKDLPVYENADKALEMAHYGDILPDKGDKLTVELWVTVDSEGKVSYKVAGAEIEDIKNNQQ